MERYAMTKRTKRLGLVFEGRPTEKQLGKRAWVRLIVRQSPQKEDKEAEELFKRFAAAIALSEYRDKYVLSIFRIGADEEAYYGILPKIDNDPGYLGIGEVRRFVEIQETFAAQSLLDF
jgi:hypothetical protein